MEFAVTIANLPNIHCVWIINVLYGVTLVVSRSLFVLVIVKVICGQLSRVQPLPGAFGWACGL